MLLTVKCRLPFASVGSPFILTIKNRFTSLLIPLNPAPGSKWTASRPQDEAEFVRILETYGVPVTVRDTRGREIDGACGQLAAAEITSSS